MDEIFHLCIHFENSNKFYFEGEKVRVKLEVKLNNPVSMNYITANFVGLGVHSNSQRKQNNLTTSKFNLKDMTEIYFDCLLPLFTAQSHECPTPLTGVQVFRFEYQLPQSLPTSVEAAYGFIRYSLQVVAEINGDFVRKTEYFTVVSKTDLRKDVSSRLPGVLWKPENQCFLQAIFCKAGPVRAFLHISKRGYVPGEYLFINAEVCNFYRLPIEWVKASLIQILKYQNSKSLKEKRIVAEITRGCVLPSETQTWYSESILVPAVPPTSYSQSKIVQIKYKLSFQYKPSWQRKPTELIHKIIIGAVGLLEYGEKQDKQSEGEGFFNSESFNDSNLEPCIFGPHSIVEDGSTSAFSPLYPICVMT